MKEGIHPEYREVAFKDVGADHVFIIRSTLQSRDKITIEGKEYPLVSLDISSKSHPFYTGKQKTLDAGGRVDKFKKRYAA
jgi:large subunit ribosomal protein L31